MKNLSRTVSQLALALAIGSIGVALVAAEEKAATKNVVISKDSIVIPATELSKADGQAMNRILRQFDKSLYKIETYENGQLKKTRGELSDVVTDKQLASEMAENVKKKGFTQYAVQVAGQGGAVPTGSPGGGTATHAQVVTTPPPPPYAAASPQGTPGGGTAKNAQSPNTPPPPPPRPAGSPAGGASSNPQQISQKESEELMKKLKPILEKYSKK